MACDPLKKLRLDAVENRHLLVGLSGGADSVALACLLAENREKYRLRITAAHYNHHIRGTDANLDAEFCRRLCAELDIPLMEGEGDVPAAAARMGVGMETAAREMRYRFLYSVMEDCGADYLALAHHMDDQAETVLMHLFRGTGPEGIGGMRLISGNIFRPLLELRKTDLTSYLRRRGTAWREDSSNGIDDTPRNALRLNVLPEIEKSYPSAAEAIARYASLARMESDYLARQCEKFRSERLRTLPHGHRILLEGEYEEVLLRRLIRQVCGRGLMNAKLEEIMALCGEKRGKTDISDEIFAEKTPSAIYFLQKSFPQTESVPLKMAGETKFGRICTIRAEAADAGSRRKGSNEEILDADALQGACIRTRREGDRIHPLGAGGDRLLSDYLTDKKIDRPLRDHLPLLAMDRRILWVCGVGIADEAKIRPETAHAIRLTYISDDSTEV